MSRSSYWLQNAACIVDSTPPQAFRREKEKKAWSAWAVVRIFYLKNRSDWHPSIFKIKQLAKKAVPPGTLLSTPEPATRPRLSCHTSLTNHDLIRGDPAVHAAKSLCVLARVTLSSLRLSGRVVYGKG